MNFQFENVPDAYRVDVFPSCVRIARAGDTTGEGGAKSMSFATFYAIAALVAAADPDGPLGDAEF
jgi:hypothetical protein